MCGIVGYIGNKEAYPILIKGLKKLEYRGYDSSGLALHNSNKVNLYKCKGKVVDLEEFISKKNISGTMGIGHTRWATHGLPNSINAHPHYSESKNLVIIHNGIIENYSSLKKELDLKGYTFRSDTDTEVLVNLIEDIQKTQSLELTEAVRVALSRVFGAYAIVVMAKDDSNRVIAARKSSPLVIGIGEGEFFLSLDAMPIVEYTKNVVYLEDGELALITRENGLKITNMNNQTKTPYIQKLEMHLEELEKGGFDHFMLKEIYEQPKSIHDSMRGRLISQKEGILLGGIKDYEKNFIKAKRIIIVACGTSWHAGLVAEYLLEDFTRIPVEVEYASEFRYRNPIVYSGDIVIAISQSGETADTLAALKLAKEKGAITFGVCNVVGSSIARETQGGLYTHAGPEVGVASTKSFTAQVTVFVLMSLMIAKKKKTIADDEFDRLTVELKSISEKVEITLKKDSLIKEVASKFCHISNVLYLGRGYGFPTALEGALKLKEISYIHAEGYPAAEMKHGPIALIDENMPVVVIATKGLSYEKILSTIQEIKARKGIVISIVTEGDTELKKVSDFSIEIPKISDPLIPLVASIPLQLLSYHIALMRDCNVDQPRNLAKSVTVE